MPLFAAIDVGSNAMRLQIAQATDPQRVSTFRSERIPVRLGHSVFQTGSLDPAVIDQAVETMRMFADAMDAADVQNYRAVVTASARGAKNGRVLIDRIRDEAGLTLSPIDGAEGSYALLDGHMRLLALRDLGHAEAPCLEALDDEAYTYNNRVNRLSSIQEHYVIRRALERGVSPERLAKTAEQLPAANLLGREGDGFALAQARLGPGRVHHCMRTIGQCELALSLATERALERTAFGKPLAEQANVQEWIAESRIEIDQARLLVLQAAWLLDQGESADGADARQVRAQVAAIKVVAARLQQRVVDRAMQIFGAMGLSPDTPLAALWTWGRALRLMDGPDEVHLRTVARHELAQARAGLGASAAWFTTPEQLRAPPHLSA